MAYLERRQTKTSTQVQTIMFRQRNRGSKILKSYDMHTYQIDSRSELYQEWQRIIKTLSCAEHRQSRVAHQRHEMGIERRQKNCKYWNLQAVVMSDYSLIATRNSHAKHKKSVGRIPCSAEVRETGMGWCTHVRADKNDIYF